MNKNCFRVVFSRVQGVLVAVAETVSGRCSSTGNSGDTSCRPLPVVWQLRVAAFGALCIFGLTPVWVAAQITPNPNAGAQQPTVATTPSGIPLVQITRPSAAGVSNNQYDRFRRPSRRGIEQLTDLRSEPTRRLDYLCRC